jgi:transmembrane protein EpsG
MGILWISLALVFSFAFFARYFATPVANTFSNTLVSIKPNRIWVFGVLLTLTLVSGLRNNIGDTFFYMHSYSINDYDWESVISGKDFGFGILQMFLQKISKDPQLLVFITALITNLLIVIILYKYTRMFELSIYVYITSGMYLVSMNGIRQFLAAAIIFAATKYILDGSWKRYILIVLFASTIHQTALILLPIYFIVRRKAWTKVTFIVLLLAIFIVLGFDKFSAILFSAIEDTQYGHYSDFAEGGASVLRVAVNAAPLVIAYLGREKLRKLFPKSDYIVNLCMLGLVFMVISTQNWIFARFNIYFGLYNLILISWVVKLFTEKDQKLVYYAILILYLMYFVYEQVLGLGIVYRSDYINI